ncbi:MAG TPA: ABC transporter ATP-binding protein [Patescibacteria group bacterium]|jgi:spermidine/putrescine transport system ATP-binding protein|nr:ABC transporter ATP-binding protein [Patescibacteria group bacterium]
MKSLQLINVSKSYGGEKILSNINLTVPLGTFFALLGPSGSGKTTLLRLIAGLETVDEGKIFLDGIDITHSPIHLRTINTVFQHYALFPHMNVFDNVAYGLRIKKISSQIIQETVKNILHIVHLTKYMYKEIHQLSGGQQQRVALARAIVNAPTILLLDEPLAALDLKLREQMLLELIELQDRLKITFIYVTHDQNEALTVADLMAIMNRKGDIEQVGTPKDTYENPKTSFVAKFVGTTNIFYGTLINTAQRQTVDIPQLGIFEVTLPANVAWVDPHQQIIMSIRPEKIDISKVPLVGFSNHIQGVVHAIVYHGRSTQYNVLLNNGMIVSVFEQNEEHFPKEVIDYDDLVHLYWQKENVILLEH